MSRLSRRQFMLGTGAAGLGLVAGCAVAPPGSPAPKRAARIGYLGPEFTVPLLRQGMADFGYVDGQNVTIEHRESTSADAPFAEAARALVSLPVELIVVS